MDLNPDEELSRLLDVHVELLAQIDFVTEQRLGRRRFRRLFRNMELARRRERGTPYEESLLAEISARVDSRRRAGRWPGFAATSPRRD